MERLKALLYKLNKPLILINVLFIIFYIILLDRYPAMWFDEGYFSNSALNLANGKGLVITLFPGLWGFDIFNFDEGPIFYLLLAAMYKIFGAGVIQSRILTVIFGMIGLNVFYFLAKEFVSNKISLLITIAFGTMPIYFIAARESRMEIYYAVFNLIAFYFLVRYFKTEKKFNRYIIYAGIFSGLSFFTHPNGLINIIAIIICLVFFNIKLTFKDIFSKKLLLSIKENLKLIIIYAIPIGLIAFPYVIFIFLNYKIFLIQGGHIFLSSPTTVISNIIGEYERYKNFFYSFGGISLANPGNFLFPGVIIIVGIAIIALIIATLFIHSYDDPFIKITFLYVLISAVLFAAIVNHKWDVYMTAFLPQIVIGLGLFLDRKPSQFTGLSGWYHQILMLFDNIKSIFQKKIGKKISIPLILCIVLIGINVYSCEINTYENRNSDPNFIRSELLAAGINSTDVLMGYSRFYMPVSDFKFVDCGVIEDRMKYQNESFNSVLTEIKPTIMIFDKYWRTTPSICLALYLNFTHYNCTLLRTINVTAESNVQWAMYFPIEVYATCFR